MQSVALASHIHASSKLTKPASTGIDRIDKEAELSKFK